MERQNSRKYNPIGTSGCYFISLGCWAEELTKRTLSKEDVLYVYAKAVSEDFMETNCFLEEPGEVMNLFLRALGSELKTEYIGWWNADKGFDFWHGYGKEDIDFMILRHKTKLGYHFKTPGFDPWPTLKRDPAVNGKRYFKILR